MSEVTEKGSNTLENNIIIERAVPLDAVAILNIKRSRWFDTYVSAEHGITSDDIYDKFTDENLAEGIKLWQKGLERNYESPDATRAVFVAKINGAVVGFTAPRIEDDGMRRLGALYVKQESQGMGIGTSLLYTALHWHGVENDVYAEVVEYNHNAIAFYEQNGFVKTGKKIEEHLDKTNGIKLLPVVEIVRFGKKS